MSIELKHLRYAEVAERCGSFRKAADLLALKQSNLSRRVRHLEEQLGVVLFERTSGGVRPTSAGRDFVNGVRRVLNDLQISEIIRRLRLLISKNTADFKPLDLNDVVRDAVGITSIQARTHGVEIHQNLAAGRLPVFGDTIQLQQVVVNLALNRIDAVKDQPKARKDIIVQATRVDEQ